MAVCSSSNLETDPFLAVKFPETNRPVVLWVVPIDKPLEKKPSIILAVDVLRIFAFIVLLMDAVFVWMLLNSASGAVNFEFSTSVLAIIVPFTSNWFAVTVPFMVAFLLITNSNFKKYIFYLL